MANPPPQSLQQIRGSVEKPAQEVREEGARKCLSLDMGTCFTPQRSTVHPALASMPNFPSPQLQGRKGGSYGRKRLWKTPWFHQ